MILDLMQRDLRVPCRRVALGRVRRVVEGHARADDIQHSGAFMGDGGFEQRLHLLGSPEKLRATKVAAADDGFQRQINGRQFVLAIVFEELAFIGGGGELAFGQPIDAVVLDNVDHRHIAADQVLVLAQADAAAVAITADADRRSGRLARVAPVATEGIRP
jgi:hypothetical protein